MLSILAYQLHRLNSTDSNTDQAIADCKGITIDAKEYKTL